MNILYVGTLPPQPDGSGMFAADLLPGLARAGHRVRAVAPITAEARQGAERFASRHPQLAVTRYEVPHFETSPLDTPPSDGYRQSEQARIREIFHARVGEERPDVVMIGRESFAPHVAPLAREHALPAVLVFHGTMTFAILHGALPHETAEQLIDSFRAVGRTVVVARHLVEPLEALGVRNLTAVPNPVDMTAFAPAPKSPELLRRLQISPDAIVVLHASNFKRLKRPLDIVGAAHEFLKAHPDAAFVMVGDGPYRPDVEEACRRTGVLERFRFAGWIEHEQMPEWLRLADLVVMPSEAEAQSLVYLEAQACGRVLVASDIPGAREVIEDGETGLLFRVGDVHDLKEKLLAAAGDAELRSRIGRQARRAVRSHEVEKVVRQYAEIFHLAMNGGGDQRNLSSSAMISS